MESNTNVTSDSESNNKTAFITDIITVHNMEHICSQIANKFSDRLIHGKERIYGITFRPNENKLVALEYARKAYGNYSEQEQKTILHNTINYWLKKGIIFEYICFEKTDHIKYGTLVHFHAIMSFASSALYSTLLECEKTLNSRYGPKSYVSFKADQLVTRVDILNWVKYMLKEQYKKIVHTIGEWTRGI